MPVGAAGGKGCERLKGKALTVRCGLVSGWPLLTQVNYGFRATSDNAAERQAVKDAFAQSVIWGFEAGAVEGDRVLVESTGFFLRMRTTLLKRSKGGSREISILTLRHQQFICRTSGIFPKTRKSNRH